MLRDLVMLGCYSVLTDETNLPRLCRIFDAVIRGKMWVPQRLLSEAFQGLLFQQNAGLSRRECEIPALLGQKFSNKCIAERLFIGKDQRQKRAQRLGDSGKRPKYKYPSATAARTSN
jgi:DNA-binding NarL/FixJ family response regulator